MIISNEQRAHDLAVSVLPHVIKERGRKYYEFDHTDTGHFNNEVIEEYYFLYEHFLKEFRN